MNPDLDKQREFWAAVGYKEEPYAVHYTDSEPAEGLSPKPMELPTAETEKAGKARLDLVFGNFSCLIGHIWRARKKNTRAWFSRERYGCLGGAYFLGYNKPQLEAIVHYVSTGMPGFMEGEHYMESPEAMREYYANLDPVPAPARYTVFDPLGKLPGDADPRLVCFFARPEVISGLHQLAMFVTNDPEVVMSPWGAGCTDLVTWPLFYQRDGRLKAVVGGWDPSCRKYYKTDEISFSMPWELYVRMVERWKESFLTTKTWKVVMKKIERSGKAWGEE